MHDLDLVSLLFIAMIDPYFVFKPSAPSTGRRAPGFLRIVSVWMSVCVCVCVCVCPPLRLLITSGMIWRDMDPMRLVKQVLQLLYGNCSRYH